MPYDPRYASSKYSNLANDLAFQILKEGRIQANMVLQMDVTNFAHAIAIGIEKGVEIEKEHQKAQTGKEEKAVEEDAPQTRFSRLDITVP